MNESKKPFPDPLVRQRIFPEPVEVFDFAPVTLSNALKDGLVVIDTNVLLVPYTTGKASLEQIRSGYKRLTQEGRLRIPGQVAREFADNRAEKLKVLFQQLSRKRDINLAKSEYPLLEDIPAYSDMVKREGEISKALADYRNRVGEVLNVVAGWQWNDPVSNIYRELFKSSAIVDPDFDREELLVELKYRQDHRIPPGFKDAANEYSGIGDLIIWKTILHIGQHESRHLIFVSGDEKTDWRYQSESQALYARFELLDEYRRISKGKSLIIISFAQLVEQLGAPATVVAEIKQEEAAAASLAESSSGLRVRMDLAEQAVIRWLLTTQYHLVARHPFPDLVAEGSKGSHGYEMKYIASAANAVRRLREALFQLSRYSSDRTMPINLVIVLDGSAANKTVVSRFRVEFHRVKPPEVLSRVIIGFLTDDRFEPQFELDLKIS
jgi:hypothetical protein